MGKEEMEVGSMMGLREGRQEREDAVDRLDEGIARAVGAEAGASVAEVEAGVEAGVGGADQGAGAGAGDGDDRGPTAHGVMRRVAKDRKDGPKGAKARE